MLDLLHRVWTNTTGLIRTLWAIQFLRFLAVGGINTAFGYGVFALFIWIGLHYVLAALLGEICGILFNFKTTGTIVFGSRDNRLIFRFFGVYLFAYLLRVGLLKTFKYFGVGPLVAAAVILLPISLLVYFLQRRLVFSAKDKTKPTA